MRDSLSPEALTVLFDQLSERQLEVLRLLAAHNTTKVIARKFGIGEYTVRAHATAARKRLGAITLREAMVLVVRYDGQSSLVSNWQSQSQGMALGLSTAAGSAHESPEPARTKPADDKMN